MPESVTSQPPHCNERATMLSISRRAPQIDSLVTPGKEVLRQCRGSLPGQCLRGSCAGAECPRELPGDGSARVGAFVMCPQEGWLVGTNQAFCAGINTITIRKRQKRGC